ncbi:Spc98 family-domain-containing protein [Roridomyces roridus]|uniref:Spindle pole body component n=1 Tax=Roridomyces roridus TaxID=1738132 RepID=A0AAD7FRW2_9AGAR|nr:Spc98 family-domain-containing protein [Roridomyces roridus]
MIPSSSSGLSVRSSSSSQRPASALSHRPPSRPTSALSTRPLSSLSTRPLSRVSQRPHSRLGRSRIQPFCQTLVSQVTGLNEGDDDAAFQSQVEYAVKSLESTTLTKAAASVDMGVIDKQVHGHVQKARINSRDELADALQTAYRKLKRQAGQNTDLDGEIKMSRLPDHLQFLISLSSTASPATLAYAETYLDGIRNPPPPPAELTWKDIFGDDPLESASSASSSSSGPSLSPLDSDLELDSEDDSDSFSSLDDKPPPPALSSPLPNEPSRPPHTYAHRREFEQLQARQYWRDDYVWPKGKGRAFDIGDASTLGPALQRVLAQESGSLGALEMQNERYIDEQDAVREILMALQGRKNIMLALVDGSYRETNSTPKLMHYSLTAQSSLLSALAETATTAQQLRNFVAFVFSSATSSRRVQSYSRAPRITRTLEAFADAVDAELRLLDTWCAAREEAICSIRAGSAAPGTRLVVSLLSTQTALQDVFEGGLGVLVEVVQTITTREYGSRYALLPHLQPAALSALLLGTLFEAVQVHRERGDGRVTADMLTRVFIVSAEPVWGMVGRWLRVGMGLGAGQSEELDDEFFIEGSGLGVGLAGLGLGVGLLDPEFWAEGYTLRDGVVAEDEENQVQNARAIPSFLEHVAMPVLQAGKAVGLLRALGVPPAADGPTSLRNWRSFGALLASSASPADSQSLSVDTLSQLVYEELAPYCEATGALLGRVLIEECELLSHLSAVEDLFLMRRGDAMSNFADVLFAKMDTQQAWGDFHFLNTAFRDVVEAGVQGWIDPSLVRLSYRGSAKDGGRAVGRTVKAITGLLVEYAMPFPIAYIFSPRILQVYGEVFVLLLQMRRAKGMLERILVRGGRGREGRLGNELKAFYAVRSRLSWFINTILNFLTTYVIHTQVLHFHEAFKKAKSLDEMIKVHDEHIEKIRGRCLLQANTSALHRAIISILDMSLQFCETFVASAGNTTITHDVSRHSILSLSKRHRSRRQRAQRRNVVSFVRDVEEEDDSSEDEEEEVDLQLDDDMDVTSPSLSIAPSFVSSVSVEDGYGRIDKMASELDGLVRFVRRGVESLAGGTGDAAASFSVLSFALEDWDL